MTDIFRNASKNGELTVEDKNKIKELNYENQEKLVDLFKNYPALKGNSERLREAVEDSNKEVFDNQYKNGRYNTEFHINTAPRWNNGKGEEINETKEIQDVLKKLRERTGN